LILQSKETVWQIAVKKTTVFHLQEIYLAGKDKSRLKVKEWEKILQANRARKTGGAAILISDKADFKQKLLRRNKEGESY
jgi:hypothetical protein